MRAHVRPGDVVVAAQVLGEPTALIEEFFRQVPDVPDLRMFVGMSLTDVMTRKPAGIAACSFVGMPPNSGLIAAGQMDLIPCHMSALPWLLTEGPLATDVALIQVSPPDAQGYCSLGVISDYAWHAVQAARVVFAEINENVPVVAGDTRVHLDRITCSIRTSRALPEYPLVEPSELELAIARGIAGYIQDGSCVQVGIGKLGEAVLRSITDRRDLGVHAGVIGDTLLELVRAGVVTNAAKEVDTGLTVSGSILGSARAVALAAADPSLRLMSVAHTHDPARVAALSNFVCVQSALEGVRVVELADEQAAHAGLLLAGLGADVVKVEPPQGSVTRRIDPFVGEASANTSLFCWQHNRGKRSLVADAQQAADLESLHALIGTADVLLLSGADAALLDDGPRFTEAALRAEFPRLVIARMTPFGDDGPWAGYHGSDLVHLAVGGVVMNCGYDPQPDGHYDLPPIAPAAWQSYIIAGEQLVIGVLAALVHQQRTGEGQSLSCAVHEAVAKSTELDLMNWVMRRSPLNRQTCRHAAERVSVVPTIAPTKDGRLWSRCRWGRRTRRRSARS